MEVMIIENGKFKGIIGKTIYLYQGYYTVRFSNGVEKIFLKQDFIYLNQVVI